MNERGGGNKLEKGKLFRPGSGSSDAIAARQSQERNKCSQSRDNEMEQHAARIVGATAHIEHMGLLCHKVQLTTSMYRTAANCPNN